MAGISDLGDIELAQGAKVFICEARFHSRINDMLLEGARSVLAASDAVIDHAVVMGALEIPTAIRLAASTGRFDAFVALGCVIRGETTHYELVAEGSARGLVELGSRDGLVIGNGILTVENEPQALVRADPAGEDKGGFAARAALALLAIKQRLGA